MAELDPPAQLIMVLHTNRSTDVQGIQDMCLRLFDLMQNKIDDAGAD